MPFLNMSWGRGEPSDETLLRAIARRERPALERLYDRYSAQVFGLTLELMPDQQSAEEVVTETFWYVWKNANNISPRALESETWIIGLAHSIARQELRSRTAAAVGQSGLPLQKAFVEDG